MTNREGTKVDVHVPRALDSQLEKKYIIAVVGTLVLLFAFWFAEAGNIGYHNVYGTYVCKTMGDKTILTLNADKTYSEDRYTQNRVEHSQGEWQLFPSDSQSHIAMHVEHGGKQLQAEKDPEIEYGQIENWFGLLSVYMTPDAGGGVFRKRLFRSHR